MGENAPHILASGSRTSCKRPRRTSLVISSPPRRQESLEPLAKLRERALCCRGQKQEMGLLSARDGIKTPPCLICLKQSRPDAFREVGGALQLLRTDWETAQTIFFGGGKSRRAAVTHALVCRRTSAARGPMFDFSQVAPLPLLFSLPPVLTSLLSLARFACLVSPASFHSSLPVLWP